MNMNSYNIQVQQDSTPFGMTFGDLVLEPEVI